MQCQWRTPQFRLAASVGLAGDSPKLSQQKLPMAKYLEELPAMQEMVVAYYGAVSPRSQARTRWLSADAEGGLFQY